MTGFACTVLFGAYQYKSYRGYMPISLYLIQLRVGAQSAAVGTMTVGMVNNMVRDLYNKYYHTLFIETSEIMIDENFFLENQAV